MFYEGCTIAEVRAFRETEKESFDFGEGEMNMKQGESEDAYYEMSLPEECYVEPEKIELPDTKEKFKLNRHDLNILHKKKLDKLSKINWWAVGDMGVYKKRYYLSRRRKYAKRMSNKKVRKTGNIGNGSDYRKVYDFWWEIL